MGIWYSRSIMHRVPMLSPCSRIVTAKTLIIKARENESKNQLQNALQLYEEGKWMRIEMKE